MMIGQDMGFHQDIDKQAKYQPSGLWVISANSPSHDYSIQQSLYPNRKLKAPTLKRAKNVPNVYYLSK